MVRNALNFSLSGNIFILFSLLKDSFAKHKILDWQFLSERIILSHYLLVSKVPVKKSAGNLVDDSLCVMCHFSLATFKILCSFKSLIVVLLGVGLWVYVSRSLCLPTNLGSSQPSFHILPTTSLFSFWDSHNSCVDTTDTVSQVL